MDVKIISDTIQEFNDVRYYLCDRYFRKQSKLLHREVYEYHKGEIEDGYAIHHIDNDPANNDVRNLECYSSSDHAKLHMSTKERKESSRKTIKIAQKHASIWYGSKEGKEWHKEQYEKHCRKAIEESKVENICEWCDKEFEINKYEGTQTCSRRCSFFLGRKKAWLDGDWDIVAGGME